LLEDGRRCHLIERCLGEHDEVAAAYVDFARVSGTAWLPTEGAAARG
jgi:hypothetical protein